MNKFLFLSKNIYLILFLILTILVLQSCSTFNETIDNKDLNKSFITENGLILNLTPVKIKGKNSDLGSSMGALIGGIAGSKISKDGSEQISQILAIGGGAIVGYYIPAILGEHNGFAYTINIEDTEKIIVVIQSNNKKQNQFNAGDLVTIVYSDKVMIIPR